MSNFGIFVLISFLEKEVQFFISFVKSFYAISLKLFNKIIKIKLFFIV